jgi:hypothetical protein
MGNLWGTASSSTRAASSRPCSRAAAGAPRPISSRSPRATASLAWFRRTQPPAERLVATSKDVSQGFRVVCAADPADRGGAAAAAGRGEGGVREEGAQTGRRRHSSRRCRSRSERRRQDARRGRGAGVLPGRREAPHGRVAGSNKPGQATFTLAWPVAANSARGAARPPSRGEPKFVVDIPRPTPADVDPENSAAARSTSACRNSVTTVSRRHMTFEGRTQRCGDPHQRLSRLYLNRVHAFTGRCCGTSETEDACRGFPDGPPALGPVGIRRKPVPG